MTSLTNSLAFLIGATSSLNAIKSFSIYASATIMMLYFSVITIFASVVYWDTKRVYLKKGDCCGIFFCKEDSIIFCRGKLLAAH